jgi:hypothetical protein
MPPKKKKTRSNIKKKLKQKNKGRGVIIWAASLTRGFESPHILKNNRFLHFDSHLLIFIFLNSSHLFKENV